MATHTTYTRRRSSSLSLRIAKRFIGVSLLATVFYRKWNRIFFTEIFFLIFPLFWKSGISNSCEALVVVVNVVDPLVRERKSPPLGIHREREREKRHPIPFSTAAQVYKVYLCKRLK